MANQLVYTKEKNKKIKWKEKRKMEKIEPRKK
jgi:hypothetical protein